MARMSSVGRAARLGLGAAIVLGGLALPAAGASARPATYQVGAAKAAEAPKGEAASKSGAVKK